MVLSLWHGLWRLRCVLRVWKNIRCHSGGSWVPAVLLKGLMVQGQFSFGWDSLEQDGELFNSATLISSLYLHEVEFGSVPQLSSFVLQTRDLWLLKGECHLKCVTERLLGPVSKWHTASSQRSPQISNIQKEMPGHWSLYATFLDESGVLNLSQNTDNLRSS